MKIKLKQSIQKIKGIFRINFIRNHFLRFGLNGLNLYYLLNLAKEKEVIKFSLKGIKHPVFLRSNTSDIKAFYQVLFNLEYEIKFNEEPEVIIDLGANIGLSSVFFLNKYPKCKVIAVEAESSNFKILKRNTEKYTNFYPYKKAIWNKSAKLQIHKSELGYWAFQVKEAQGKETKTVEAISLHQIIKEHNISRIDVLKIDIEGAEVELFSGNYDDWLSITKYIVIETHDWLREGCAKTVFGALSKYNFTLSIQKENLVIVLNN